MDLRRQCQKFAVDLLHQSRNSQELAIILNHDPENPTYEEGEHMKLARLELAIQFKQKKVCFRNLLHIRFLYTALHAFNYLELFDQTHTINLSVHIMRI